MFLLFILEKSQAFGVTLAVPGLQRGDFAIEIDNRVLAMSLKKKGKKSDATKRRSHPLREFLDPSSSEASTLQRVKEIKAN